MLIFVAVEQAAMRADKFMRFENIIKADSVEAAREKAVMEFGTFKPENVKEVRPATMEDVEKMLDADCDEVLVHEVVLRDATKEELDEMDSWKCPEAPEGTKYPDII